MTDGRSKRAVRTHRCLVDACRALMVKGTARPPMAAIVKEAQVSTRSGFQHFRRVENLWREALWEPAVGVAVLARKLGDELPKLSLVARDRALRAIVFDDDASGEPLPVLLLLPGDRAEEARAAAVQGGQPIPVGPIEKVAA